MKNFAVVQHTYSEFLGLIENHLEKRDIGFSYQRPFVGQGLPGSAGQFDALFLLGGAVPPTAIDDCPWLADELRLIEIFEKSARPIVGLGLGALLLAQHHGAKVQEKPAHSAYFSTAHCTEAGQQDPLARHLDARKVLVLFQGDAELPSQIEPLLVDDHGHWLAIRPRRDQYGFLFRPELKPGMLEDMLMEADREVPENIGELLSEARNNWREMQETTDQLLVALVKELDLMRERRKAPVFNLKVEK